jgi:hypothetical protein
MLLTGTTRLMICARRKLSLPLPPLVCVILIAISVVVSNEDDGHADTPYLFRTYDHHGEPEAVKNPGPAHRHEIWKVARATSAAPTYFSPVIIDHKEYYDGGIGNNNPVMLMLEEVAAKAETKSYDEAMSIVVSIGAGLKPSKRLRAKHRFPRITSLRPLKAISKVLDKLKETSTDSEETTILSRECSARSNSITTIVGMEEEKWADLPLTNGTQTRRETKWRLTNSLRRRSNTICRRKTFDRKLINVLENWLNSAETELPTDLRMELGGGEHIAQCSDVLTVIFC